MNNKIPIEKFRCVVCGSKLIIKDQAHIFCTNDSCIKHINPYRLLNNKAVLIDFNKSLLNENSLFKSAGESSVKRTKNATLTQFRNFLRVKNKIVENNIELLTQEILKYSNPKILVIGGGEIGNGFDKFFINFADNITSFDIYNSSNVDFIADAHQIPLIEEYFDLVIVQAVLEHVLVPTKVVNEIWRVLKFDGLVYAETPFMQQVHEGRFDFLRFSESGHRYLFKKFKLVKSGHILGVGTSLIWAIDYFISGLFRSRLIGKLLRISLFWVSYVDNFIPNSFNIDGASGVYFIGKKSDITLNPREILNHYKGNQH